MENRPLAIRRRLVKLLKNPFVWCVLAGVLVVVLLLLSVQGRIRPIRVFGGSMADSLVGPHFFVTCRDCGVGFRCGIEFPPVDDLAVCPNCGYSENAIDPTQLLPGQRILVDRADRIWKLGFGRALAAVGV